MIGAIVLEGFYVVYNREEKTIQFAQSNCNAIDPEAVRSTIQGNVSLSGIPLYSLVFGQIGLAKQCRP